MEEGRSRDDIRFPLRSTSDSAPLSQYSQPIPKETGSELEKDFNLPRVLLCVIFACAGSFAFGSNLGIINGPLPAIATDLGFPGDTVKQGAVVSSALFGAAFGSFLGGSHSNKTGRRVALAQFCVPMAVGALLQIFASNFPMILAGRVLTGFGIGASSSVVPIYISEVAPSKIRGALGTLNQLIVCIGILGSLVINVLIPAQHWRNIFMITLAPIIVLFLGMLSSPESPVWLKSQGRNAQANKVSQLLWKSNIAQVSENYGETSGQGQGEAKSISISQIVSEKQYRSRVLVGCSIFALQQLAGINAIVYFSSQVFQKAGLQSQATASALVGLTNVIGTVFATFLIEKMGRKTLLSFSFLTMGICMFVLSAGFSLPQLTSYSGQIALGGTMVYIFGFALGCGPIPALITPEILPYNIRGQGVSLAMTTHWLFNFGIGQLFLVACDKFGISSIYAFFGLVCILGSFYAKTSIPEGTN